MSDTLTTTTNTEPVYPYSVLLRRPDYMTDGEDEFFYTFTMSANTTEAVEHARREAAAAGDDQEMIDDLFDYALILIIEGHHDDLCHLVEGN